MLPASGTTKELQREGDEPQYPQNAGGLTVLSANRGAGVTVPSYTSESAWKQWWPVPVAVAACFIHARYRRRRLLSIPPRSSPPQHFALNFKDFYAIAALIALSSTTNAAEKIEAYWPVRGDRDLVVVEAAARHESARWKYTDESFWQWRPPAFRMETSPGLAGYFTWIRDHADGSSPTVWDHYYRHLVQRYAEKYPSITPAEWDICITHIARNIGNHDPQDTVSSLTKSFKTMGCAQFLLATCLSTAGQVWLPSRFRLLTLGLNGLTRASLYLWIVEPVTNAILHAKKLTGIQHREQLSTMLHEVFPDIDALVDDLKHEPPRAKA
ncbi:hypothetical protein C8Q79DRAFT_331119 [Trametes meyenii]|nr:hypothetical protein C8Q79DRAFT_331119 [Trametes meyenii]